MRVRALRWWAILGGLAVLAGRGAIPIEPVALGAVPLSTIGAPFALQGTAGQIITSGQFHGRFLLIYFGYTGCPDQCPLTLEAIAGAMRRLGPRAALVQPLFITIDPGRDSPQVIAQYTKLFSRHIIGLTGSVTAVRRAEAAFHVYVGAADPKTGSIPHSTFLYLLGPQGRFRTALAGNLTASALAVALDRMIPQSNKGLAAARPGQREKIPRPKQYDRTGDAITSTR